MSYNTVKALARKLGMYRAARWVHRHIMNRDELRALRDELRFYAQFVEPGSLCFDVGANYGAKTEVFLRLGARVVAFEPQSDCMQELRARLGRHPRLVPVNAAVGSSNGKMTLYVGGHRTCSSFVREWQGDVVGSVEVPVTTLDDAIEEFGVPRYCKIDVEGFELEVLRGLTHAVPVVSFEYHLERGGVAQALACLDRLSSLGELLVNVTPAERSVLAGEQWRRKTDFIDFFVNSIPRMPGYYYGDIFVRINAADREGLHAETAADARP
jgi:FkbM family methyltransferase